MKLTASDRSALIKLASSLPKGSEERRAILAGFAPLDWSGSDNDVVEVDLSPYRGQSIFKGKMSVREAKDLDKLLASLYDFSSGDLGMYRQWQQTFKRLDQKLKDIKKKWGKTIQKAQKLGIWDYYEDGGDPTVPVYFEDSEGNAWQIVDDDIEQA